MAIAKVVATRSPDESRQFGAVLVDKKNRILSVGYNGPPQGIPNEIVPQTRPNKYYWMIHAEENMLLFCKENTYGCSVYVNGRPCCNCLKKLIQAGISKVYYTNVIANCVNDEDLSQQEIMLANSSIKLIEIYENEFDDK